MNKEHPEIDAEISDFSMTATYIPQKIPLREGKTHPYAEDLNKVQFKWHVQLFYKGRELLETPFSCGIGCFRDIYKPPTKWLNDELKKFELVLRDGYTYNRGIGLLAKGSKLEPDLRTVIWCLISDSSAIDYPSYEQWAPDFGYDEDSRKGEQAYRECLKTGLTLRAALGEAKLQELRVVYQDF